MDNNRNISNITELIALLILSGAALGAYYLWKSDQSEPGVSSNGSTVGFIIPTTTTSTAPQLEYGVDTGGPAPGHIVTNKIQIATGFYWPTKIDIKRGDAVTWESFDIGLVPNSVESDNNFLEVFSSGDLRAGDKFSHTFNSVGVYNWHDKYNGSLKGSITVTD